MSIIYFPSCKFTAKFPEVSIKIKQYMADRHGAEVAGCCKRRLDSLTEEDTIVYICNTCAALCEEGSRAGKTVSVWEIILDDPDFLFNHTKGRSMTVQDCWRTYDNKELQDAVRALLQHMRIEAVEQAGNREKTRYCGISLYQTLPERYDLLAPKRFVDDAKDLFIPCPEEEQKVLMQAHCDQIGTEEVLCTCVACVNGIDLGGRSGVHLAELLFS